jgi:hypothetical protein
MAQDKIEKTVKNVRDAVTEHVHRGDAAAERELRRDFGETMTPGEKAKSIGHEASEEAKAEIDRAKRKLREHE